MDRITKRELDAALHKRVLELAPISNASSIFCFVSLPDEVDTHHLIKALLTVPKQLAVPQITPKKTMLAVELQSWDQLSAGELGILTLTEETPVTDDIEVCITPGLGFSERGDRIGFGRGYYDSWFREHHHTYRIALAYEYQILDNIPTDKNDIKMDMIVTEKRVIEITS